MSLFNLMFQVQESPIQNRPKAFFNTGQSNMVGFAPNADIPIGELGIRDNLKIYVKNVGFESLEVGVNSQAASSSHHGIELHLANKYGTTEDPVYFVKYAVGSTAISHHLSGGSVYEEFYNNYLIPAKAILDAQFGVGAYDFYLLFWQGESDGSDPVLAAQYEANFNTWVSLWQSNLGASLKIRAFEIHQFASRDAVNPVFNAKATTELSLEVVPSQDFDTHDGTHFSYQGYKDSIDVLPL